MGELFDDNCNPYTNGEYKFFQEHVQPTANVIFDIGCRDDSIFTEFVGDVHYFDPFPESIRKLSLIENNNRQSYFNPFGLSNSNGTLYYYPTYQSFHNRHRSCGVDDEKNRVTLEVRQAIDYIRTHNISHIDFIKIDTEGHELQVLQGFGDMLRIVDIIQFEYGGTYLDNGIRLIDVIDFLKDHGFVRFCYITPQGITDMTDFEDHYRYCNVICLRK